MSKRYAEPIEVEASDGTLEAFRWRGKRYVVRQVICRWREAGGWWTGAGTDKPWHAGVARELLRVDAIGGRAKGTYELARDLRSGAWTLDRVWD